MNLPQENEDRMAESQRQNPREPPIFESRKRGVAHMED